MASSVFEEKEISLQDGTDVVLKPLPIAPLRRFMAAWQQFENVKNEDDGFTVFVNCAGIALERNFKGKFDSLKATVTDSNKGEFLSSEYKEYLEDTLDLDTIYLVLEVCGGLKLNDPKLLDLAAELESQAKQEDGTN